MGNRFTRNIQNVRNIDKLPLNTNEQNDLISDKKGNVYVRNLSSYERITGLKKLEDAFNILQERLKDFDPNNEEVENLTKKINNNKIELEKKIKSIQTEIKELPNYANDIKTLDEKIEKEITTLQKELDNIEIQDYSQDINNINKRIDDLDIKNYDDDIKKINQRIDDFVIPNYETSGWVDIDLINDVQIYSDDEKPQYKIIYKDNEIIEIYLRGAVTNINDRNTVIGNIPINNALTQKHVFIQASSLKHDTDKNVYAPTVRWEIQVNGDIEFIMTSYILDKLKNTDWLPIATIVRT